MISSIMTQPSDDVARLFGSKKTTGDHPAILSILKAFAYYEQALETPEGRQAVSDRIAGRISFADQRDLIGKIATQLALADHPTDPSTD
ncbi:hypothetical protein HYV73_02750 [Candidatus Uhrbacteria bacterium]|nr:hypothetical protein [Candidatus Uhrbacteria bacterium]